jgi:hypothetical protein
VSLQHLLGTGQRGQRGPQRSLEGHLVCPGECTGRERGESALLRGKP